MCITKEETVTTDWPGSFVKQAYGVDVSTRRSYIFCYLFFLSLKALVVTSSVLSGFGFRILSFFFFFLFGRALSVVLMRGS